MMEQKVSYSVLPNVACITTEPECRNIGGISLMELIAANIYIVAGCIDIRINIDGLFAIAINKLKEESNNHSIYLFCWKRYDRIKALLYEPGGYVFYIKGLMSPVENTADRRAIPNYP